MFAHFLISATVSSLTTVGIMLIKKGFHNHLSAKWQYRLWFLLLLALTLPFLPLPVLHVGNQVAFDGIRITGLNGTASAPGNRPQQEGSWLQDFTISIHDSTPVFLDGMVTVIWITGMAVFAALTIRAWFKMKSLKSTCSRVNNQEVLTLFEQCKKDAGITKPLVVVESPLVTSPMMFGLFTTYVVLPTHADEWLTMNEIKHIFLHELMHLKHHDLVTNYLMVLYQMVYWFNPLVWIAFRDMRLDREIACDMAVLQVLDKDGHVEYGKTIIHFLDRESRSRHFAFSSQLNGSKGQIRKRIERIASFTVESTLAKLKSIAVFVLAGVLVASQVPLVSAMADDQTRYEFTHERIMYEDLNAYFSGFAGSFVLYDLQADQYHIYNEEQSRLRVSPDSTYKIFLALFGLESNVISRENSTIQWDGVQYPYKEWNQDQDVATAMESSVNWYFQELDDRIGQDRLQAYLQQIGYGNEKLSGGATPYWLESSLLISPVEQVNLLKALYTNQFGFQETHVETVKDAIRLAEKDGKLLSGKTGTGSVNNQNINGWFVGYVEDSGNTYFFATNIQSEGTSNGSTAAEITLSILRDKGIY